jgi:hypothetical protein
MVVILGQVGPSVLSQSSLRVLTSPCAAVKMVKEDLMLCRFLARLLATLAIATASASLLAEQLSVSRLQAGCSAQLLFHQ